MNKRGTILVVDDNKGILAALQLLLGSVFEKVITSSSPNNLLYILQQEPVDIVLLDMNFTSGPNNGNEGLFWLHEIKKEHADVSVVLFTAYADIDLAVRGIKEGASDFIVKPFDNQKLLSCLQNTLSIKKNSKSAVRAKPAKQEEMFWGESKAMLQLRKFIEKVALTDATILITGENGTGKGMLANEIHKLSRHNKEKIVHVDLGAISETLFESELFGHVKGAFTDAKTDRTGKFEEAENGTLFLDEIANLSYPLQAKLLTVIQQKKIVKVGSNTPVPVSTRLICATNQNLQELVNRKEFREDLFYRINTIHVEIPPLRERPEEIVLLAEIFIKKFAERYHKPFFKLNDTVKRKLSSYAWYGNIRELEHVIERAVIVGEGDLLNEEHFYLKEKESFNAVTLEDMEKIMIQKTLDKFDGNLSAAAQELGITRQTLYNKMKKFEL